MPLIMATPLRAISALLLISLLRTVFHATFAQEQPQPIQDLDALVGKKVLARETPLCQPDTYSQVSFYTGKVAKVISKIKSSKYSTFVGSILNADCRRRPVQ